MTSLVVAERSELFGAAQQVVELDKADAQRGRQVRPLPRLRGLRPALPTAYLHRTMPIVLRSIFHSSVGQRHTNASSALTQQPDAALLTLRRTERVMARINQRAAGARLHVPRCVKAWPGLGDHPGRTTFASQPGQPRRHGLCCSTRRRRASATPTLWRTLIVRR